MFEFTNEQRERLKSETTFVPEDQREEFCQFVEEKIQDTLLNKITYAPPLEEISRVAQQFAAFAELMLKNPVTAAFVASRIDIPMPANEQGFRELAEKAKRLDLEARGKWRDEGTATRLYGVGQDDQPLPAWPGTNPPNLARRQFILELASWLQNECVEFNPADLGRVVALACVDDEGRPMSEGAARQAVRRALKETVDSSSVQT